MEKYGPECLTAKAARVLAGMRQDEAAQGLGTTVYVLRNIEKGRSPLTLRMARNMAKLYGLPGEFVFRE